MPGRGLLSRLDASGTRATRGLDEHDSIVEHLRVLLNARRGNSPSAPEFGIAADDLLTWGVVSADLTGDGYPEVYISNGLGLQPRDDELFSYTGPAKNHWVAIDAVGRAPDPSALDAKVEVRTASRTITRWVGGWSSFDSQGDHTVVVGLGDETAADVTSPSGRNGRRAPRHRDRSRGARRRARALRRRRSRWRAGRSDVVRGPARPHQGRGGCASGSAAASPSPRRCRRRTT
jgi:hypothetical protein